MSPAAKKPRSRPQRQQTEDKPRRASAPPQPRIGPPGPWTSTSRRSRAWSRRGRRRSPQTAQQRFHPGRQGRHRGLRRLVLHPLLRMRLRGHAGPVGRIPGRPLPARMPGRGRHGRLDPPSRSVRVPAKQRQAMGASVLDGVEQLLDDLYDALLAIYEARVGCCDDEQTPPAGPTATLAWTIERVQRELSRRGAGAPAFFALRVGRSSCTPSDPRLTGSRALPLPRLRQRPGRQHRPAPGRSQARRQPAHAGLPARRARRRTAAWRSTGRPPSSTPICWSSRWATSTA